MKMPLQDWLEHLRGIAPIAGVVHVGAGNGNCAEQYAEWDVPLAVLVEADEDYREKLSAAARSRPGWRAYIAMIGDDSGECDFHVASNPSESGSLKPENFGALWRNLRTTEIRHVRSFKLDEFVGPTTGIAAPNWLVVDCFPAVPILQGAAALLDHADVILSRVILDERVLALPGAAKVDVDKSLSGLGYRCIATEEDRQPATGWALYMRDWRLLLERRLKEAGDEQEDAVNKLRSQLAGTTAALAEQVQLTKVMQEKINQESSARIEQTKLADQRWLKLEQFTKEQQEQATVVAEQKQRLAAASLALDEQVQVAQARQEQVEQLGKALNEQLDLAVARQGQLEQLIEAMERHALLATESKQKIEQLTIACSEYEQRANAAQFDLRALADERDTQVKLARDAVSQAEKLKVERDEQASLADNRGLILEQSRKAAEEQQLQIADLQAQVLAMTTARDDTHGHIRQLEAKDVERTAFLADYEQQIERLTLTCNENEQRVIAAQSELIALGEERKTQSTLALEATAQIEQLSVERDKQTKLANDRWLMIEQFKKAADEQAGMALEAKTQIEQLKIERDKQTLLADDRWLKLEQHKKAADEQLRQLADLQAQVVALSGMRDEAKHMADEYKVKLAEITPRAEAFAARIETLERERVELDVRHGRLDQEMMKAEIQIELIKDVILRDKAF